MEKSTNLHPKDEHSSFESPPIQHHRSLSYSFSANLFNTYNLLSTSTRNDFLHEEDSEEDDDDDDEDSHDDEEEIKPSSSQPMFTSRSFSPSMFYHHQHKPTKTLLSQETTATAGTNETSSTVLVDYIPRLSPTVPIVSTSSRLLSATKCLNTSDSPVISEENKELLFHHSQTELNDELRQSTADLPSRNDTSLSKPMWPEDDEPTPLPDEHPSPHQPLIFRRQNSTTSTTAMTSVPTLPQLIKKPSLPSTSQRFYHPSPPSFSRSISTDQQSSKSSPRSLLPLSHARRLTSNVHSNHSQQSLTNTTSNEIKSNTDSFNEHLMLNRRIEMLKTPGKQQQQQSSVPSATSTTSTNVPPPPPPAPSKRQDIKSIPTTPVTSSIRPTDSTKVTIGK